MFYKDLKGPALFAFQTMVAELKRRAMEELGLPESEIVVRSLRPEDIGKTTPSFHFATGGTGWRSYVNTFTVADNRFIGINGFSDGSSNTTQLKVSRGASDARFWNIQHLPNNENKLTFLDDPILVDQNTQLTIQAYALASATEKLRLFGAVAEKKGVLVSP